MRLVDGIKEVTAFTAEIILSCGPSQIYGLVKGVIDLVKYAQIRLKIYRWQEIQNKYKSQRYDELKQTKAFKKVVKYNNQSDFDRLNSKAEQRLFELQQRGEVRVQSLIKDFVSLIPVIGALFAWRIGAPEEERSLWKHTSFVKYATAHALQDIGPTIAVNSLYFHYKHENDCRRVDGQFDILVPGTHRALDAVFAQGANAKENGPTVVLFHGNAMIGHEHCYTADWYVSRGFNVLLVTMGGYDGSPGIRTSEQSSYQDVEAIKKHLEGRGIKHVGFHGLSLGGTMALQGAVGKTETNLKIMFAVADKTFTSTKDVFYNTVCNGVQKIFSGETARDIITGALKPLIEGAALAATPLHRKIKLSKNLIIETDGLDNKAKAAQMKAAKIPLFTIKASQDFLMGRNWDDDQKQYQDNFADDLLKARYGKLKTENQIILPGKWGHGENFLGYSFQQVKMQDFLFKARDKALAAAPAV